MAREGGRNLLGVNGKNSHVFVTYLFIYFFHVLCMQSPHMWTDACALCMWRGEGGRPLIDFVLEEKDEGFVHACTSDEFY